MQDEDDIPIANLVPSFLGDAVRSGRAQERRRKETEEAAAAAVAEDRSSLFRPDFEPPSLADESSRYRDDIREDDSDANSEVDPDEVVISDHVRLEGLL